MNKIEAKEFVKLFEKIYESADAEMTADVSKIREIPRFTIDELQEVLNKLKDRKVEDTSHIIIEMIKHAGLPFLEVLLQMYNSILETGNTPPNWHVIIFRMLPKNGDLTDVNNWRPIAVLPILYKIFSKLVYSRIHQILESNQSDDQFVFRKDRRIDDVFGILENIVGKTSEWNLPLWIASLDLRKAFDRILHQPLFRTLRLQKVPESYVQLLVVLYKNQKGSIDGKVFFAIRRGVKQGDVLSAILFNAVLEEAFIQWKSKLVSEGFLLKENTSRLTNVRYADDILLFAKSREELEMMMVLLIVELGKVGLD